MNDKAIKHLAKALKNKVADDFVDGDVISWVSAGRYTYAAVKAAGRWYITSGDYCHYVKRVFSFDELLEILNLAEVSKIRVAVEWKKL